jgi:RNA polymerase sigma-70 factor, ECF subfamily
MPAWEIFLKLNETGQLLPDWFVYMIERSDAELVARCRQNDDRAFEQLVIRHQKPVYHLALRMTHNRAVAEEITQAVFVKTFEKLDSYKPEYPFGGWLYRIAVNESLNEIRTRRRCTELDESLLMDEQGGTFELQDLIQDALMLLRPRDRALVILRHFIGLGYRDIGDIVNLSEKKVKAHLFTARHSLKEILGRMGVNNEN